MGPEGHLLRGPCVWGQKHRCWKICVTCLALLTVGTHAPLPGAPWMASDKDNIIPMSTTAPGLGAERGLVLCPNDPEGKQQDVQEGSGQLPKITCMASGRKQS